MNASKKQKTGYSELKAMMAAALDTEKAVLNCLLFNRDIQERISLLSEEDFYNISHREIFSYFKKTLASGTSLDPALVPDDIRKNSQWFSVIDALGLKAMFGQYVLKLKEKTNQRKIAHLAHKLNIAVQEDRNSLEVKNYALEVLEEIKGSIKKSVESEDVWNKFEKEVLNKEGYAGIKTGLPKYDNLTRGFCRGTFNIVGGTPAVGKTTFILNMAVYMCANLKGRVLYVSLEMDYVMVYAKMVSLISGIPVAKMLSTRANLSLFEWKKVMDAASKISDYKFHFMGEDKTRVTDIENEVRILGKVDIIFVDYLQLLSPEGSKKTRYEEISQISRDLKKMATRLNTPVVTVASINRSYVSRMDKKPSISDLRDSGNIEYDADSIIFVYRESAFRDPRVNEDKEEFSHSGELILAKNRYGICNISIDLYWDGDRALFKEKDNG